MLDDFFSYLRSEPARATAHADISILEVEVGSNVFVKDEYGGLLRYETAMFFSSIEPFLGLNGVYVSKTFRESDSASKTGWEDLEIWNLAVLTNVKQGEESCFYLKSLTSKDLKKVTSLIKLFALLDIDDTKLSTTFFNKETHFKSLPKNKWSNRIRLVDFSNQKPRSVTGSKLDSLAAYLGFAFKRSDASCTLVTTGWSDFTDRVQLEEKRLLKIKADIFVKKVAALKQKVVTLNNTDEAILQSSSTLTSIEEKIKGAELRLNDTNIDFGNAIVKLKKENEKVTTATAKLLEINRLNEQALDAAKTSVEGLDDDIDTVITSFKNLNASVETAFEDLSEGVKAADEKTLKLNASIESSGTKVGEMIDSSDSKLGLLNT